MLHAMNRHISDRRVEQTGGMPRPDRDAMQHGRIAARAEPVPGSDDAAALKEPPRRYPRLARQGPKHRADWTRGNQQRRGNRHHDLMLDHVKCEKMLAEPMQRRDQRAGQRDPADAKDGSACSCRGANAPAQRKVVAHRRV